MEACFIINMIDMKTTIPILRLLLCCTLALPALAHAQHFLKEFQGVADPVSGHIRPTADGGYILSGSYASGGTQAGMLLAKTDADFQVQWSEVLQSSNGHLDYGIDAIETSDGGFLVLGAYDTEIWKAPLLAKLDYCLVKTDAQGNIQWAKRYGGGRTDIPYELSETADGNYIITGYSSQGTSALGNPQPFLLKVTPDGSIIWSRLQRAFAFNITTALAAHPSFTMKSIQTSDGGTFYGISTGELAWLVKMDANGQILWQQKANMGGSVMGGDAQALWGVAAAGGFIADMVERPNGDIVMLGNVFYFIAIGNGQNGGSIYIPVAFLMNISSAGQVGYAQAFFHPTGQSGNVTDLYASDLELLPNGNILVGGAIGGYKAFLAEIDPSESQIDQAKVWARGFGWLNLKGYPYDYDNPEIAIAQDGNYLVWFDRLKLKQIDAGSPESDSCSHPIAINSFAFQPALSSGTATIDSIMQEHPVAFQANPTMMGDTVICADQTTSLFQEILPQALTFYPNPSQGSLTIEIPGDTRQLTSLSITDLHGRLIQQHQHQTWPGDRIPLQLSVVPDGMYLLRVENEEGVFTGKLLLRR